MCEIEREGERQRERNWEQQREKERKVFGEIERKQGLIELGNLVGERERERERENGREIMPLKRSLSEPI